jgi:hypothetical protein
MSHTFIVDKGKEPTSWAREIQKDRTKPFLEHKDISEKVVGRRLYATKVATVGGLSPLHSSLSFAFNNHCPWVITPDAVWLTCLTGLCHHIDLDPEGLRRHFVTHEGQKQLTVKVASPPGVATASIPEAVWMAGIRLFSEALEGELVGKKHALIVNHFSTTTEIDKLSSKVALMGAMKHYFKYKMMLLCGLGRVTVEGTPDDWADIEARVRVLSEFGLEWWTEPLLPVIEQLRLTCNQMPNRDFWRQAYLQHRVGSGSQYNVSGWVNAFYPYVAGKREGEMVRNPYVDWQKDHGGRGLDTDDYPFGMISVPVLVDDHGQEFNCKFYGGLVGVSMSAEDFTVRPESGIAITDVTEVGS